MLGLRIIKIKQASSNLILNSTANLWNWPSSDTENFEYIEASRVQDLRYVQKSSWYNRGESWQAIRRNGLWRVFTGADLIRCIVQIWENKIYEGLLCWVEMWDCCPELLQAFWLCLIVQQQSLQTMARLFPQSGGDHSYAPLLFSSLSSTLLTPTRWMASPIYATQNNKWIS